MMVFMGALLFALLVVHPMGGRILLLRESQFRLEILIPVGLFVQLLPPRLLEYFDSTSAASGTLISWFLGGALILLVCGVNWPLFGFRLIALGVLANGVVIALNQGMPVSPAALDYMGLVETGDKLAVLTPLYHLAHEGSRLLVLADVLPVPGPALLRSVVSLGDLLLMVGVALVILEGTRSIVCIDSR